MAYLKLRTSDLQKQLRRPAELGNAGHLQAVDEREKEQGSVPSSQLLIRQIHQAEYVLMQLLQTGIDRRPEIRDRGMKCDFGCRPSIYFAGRQGERLFACRMRTSSSPQI